MGCLSYSGGFFPTQGLNLHLLCCQADSLPLSHLGYHCNCTVSLESLWRLLDQIFVNWDFEKNYNHILILKLTNYYCSFDCTTHIFKYFFLTFVPIISFLNFIATDYIKIFCENKHLSSDKSVYKVLPSNKLSLSSHIYKWPSSRLETYSYFSFFWESTWNPMHWGSMHSYLCMVGALAREWV